MIVGIILLDLLTNLFPVRFQIVLSYIRQYHWDV